MTVRWGVIGAGRVAGTWTCPAIAQNPSSDLSVVVARSADAGRDFAEKHGFEAVASSLEALLEDPALDAVYIATPNALHAEQVIACAERGKAVLCEKPLALTVGDARSAVSAAEAADVVLGVTFQYRYHPAIVRARDVIASGEIGAPILAQAEIGGLFPLRTWRRERDLAGFGAIVNMGVHVYDAIEFVTGGRIASVSAVTNASPATVETLALALFELDNGVLAYANANQNVPHATPDLIVDCEEGRIHVHDCFRLGAESRLEVVSGPDRHSSQLGNEQMFRALIAGFVEAVEAGAEAPIPGDAGVHSAAVVEAIVRSAATGARVETQGARVA